MALAPRLISRDGAAFLRLLVTRFPSPVEAVQSDGGSEFLKEFGPVAKELKLTHYFNHLNYPQGNGRIERSFRTEEDEFYQVEEMPAHLGGIEAALLQWNHVLPSGRTILLHQALAYKTPEQFYQDWLTTHTRKEGLLSDMP